MQRGRAIFLGGGVKEYLFLKSEKERRQPAVGAGRAGGVEAPDVNSPAL